MSESVQTTLEEASRCPRCEVPGRFNGERPLRSGDGKVKVFLCENARCRWYNTTWTVQVNANGTIPPPLLTRDKQFRPLPKDGGNVVRGLERQLDLETGGGGEVSRPR